MIAAQWVAYTCFAVSCQFFELLKKPLPQAAKVPPAAREGICKGFFGVARQLQKHKLRFRC